MRCFKTNPPLASSPHQAFPDPLMGFTEGRRQCPSPAGISPPSPQLRPVTSTVCASVPRQAGKWERLLPLWRLPAVLGKPLALEKMSRPVQVNGEPEATWVPGPALAPVTLYRMALTPAPPLSLTHTHVPAHWTCSRWLCWWPAGMEQWAGQQLGVQACASPSPWSGLGFVFAGEEG